MGFELDLHVTQKYMCTGASWFRMCNAVYELWRYIFPF